MGPRGGAEDASYSQKCWPKVAAKRFVIINERNIETVIRKVCFSRRLNMILFGIRCRTLEFLNISRAGPIKSIG